MDQMVRALGKASGKNLSEILKSFENPTEQEREKHRKFRLDYPDFAEGLSKQSIAFQKENAVKGSGISDLRDRQNHTFEKFEENYLDSSNAKTFRMVRDWDVSKDFGFILCGPPGCGKTHLLKALSLSRCSLKFRFRFQVWGDFLNLVRSDFKAADEQLARLVDCDALCLDEIGFGSSDREWTQTLICDILNGIKRKGGTFFGTTNLCYQEVMDSFDPRVVDRMKMLTSFISFSAPSHRERIFKHNIKKITQIKRGS